MRRLEELRQALEVYSELGESLEAEKQRIYEMIQKELSVYFEGLFKLLNDFKCKEITLHLTEQEYHGLMYYVYNNTEGISGFGPVDKVERILLVNGTLINIIHE